MVDFLTQLLSRAWAVLHPPLYTLAGMVIGALVSALPAYYLGKRQWRRENRKREWEDLLSTVAACGGELRAAKSSRTARKIDGDDCRIRVARLLRTRLFTKKTIESAGLEEEWQRIERLAEPTDPSSVTDLSEALKTFELKLKKLAARDLN